jgi:hypothetical protein
MPSPASVTHLAPLLVSLALLAVLVLPDVAHASPQSRVTPTVTCVEVNTDGSITAHWGYVNVWTNQVTVQIGDRTSGKNLFAPGAEDRGQPTAFDPGTHDDVLTVTFTGTSLTWTLDDSKDLPANAATASASSTRCAPVPALGVDSPLPLALAAVAVCALVVARRRRVVEVVA